MTRQDRTTIHNGDPLSVDAEEVWPQHADDWFARHYQELLQRARLLLSPQPGAQPLGPSDLLHEAWLRLAAGKQRWEIRSHFMATATNAMRCVLIDKARHDATVRHGVGWRQVEMNGHEPAGDTLDAPAVSMLQEALEQLAARDPAKSELVKLRYFDGLTLKEAAAALGVSEPTAKRHWTYARAWLCQQMQRDGRNSEHS